MLRRHALTRLIQCAAILQIAATLALVAAALLAAFSGPAGASITGVCPDGSIYIVQSPSAIPCSDSKQVEPHDVPPLKPEMLPRPYGWDVLQRRQDPNNPYNAVDAAPSLRRPEAGGARGTAAGSAPPRTGEPVEGATHPPAPEPRAPEPVFSPEELRDLARIVELAQGRTPATFSADASSAGGPVVLRLARSRAFEPRLREQWAARGRVPAGHVLLFAAEAQAPASFHAQLTFVQGQTTFHPDARAPEQLGVLEGALGALAPGESVLGYALLPESIDLRRPLDVYWNDRLLTATFEPGS